MPQPVRVGAHAQPPALADAQSSAGDSARCRALADALQISPSGIRRASPDHHGLVTEGREWPAEVQEGEVSLYTYEGAE